MFDQTLSVATLREILETKDITRFEEAKIQSFILISAAVLNGNERESDKFGKLMELVELKFGKKPERMSEIVFMQKVASELLSRLGQHVRLCVGEQYIKGWATRQFA